MNTHCTAGQLEFHGLGRREVIGKFDGGKISSDGRGLLLREVEKRTHIVKRFAECFVDHRDPELIEHSVEPGKSNSPQSARRNTKKTNEIEKRTAGNGFTEWVKLKRPHLIEILRAPRVLRGSTAESRLKR